VSGAQPPGTRVVAGALHRFQRGRGKRFAAAVPVEPSRRPARVAVTLALAHTIQRAIDRGEIRDQAEAARRLGLTRARMTQILGLTFLAPDLQDLILFDLPPNKSGAFRTASIAESWTAQRTLLLPLLDRSHGLVSVASTSARNDASSGDGANRIRSSVQDTS
jgi:hypothetical protein